MHSGVYGVVVGGAALAVILAAVVTRNPWLTLPDVVVMQLVLTVRNPVFTTIMEGVTALGTWVAYAVVLVAAVPLARQRGIKVLVVAILSLLLAQLVRVGLNVLVHRPRPPRSDWLVPANLYSFPSGHTALAGVGFGLVAWLLWMYDRRIGLVAAVVAGVACLAVAASRVYLGVHWPSDVLGSMLFAIIWISATILVASRWVAA